VRKLTRIALEAFPVTESGASDGRVDELSWITALSLFATVGIGALGPVMATHSRTPLYLISVHAELVGAEDNFVNGIVVVLGRYEVGNLVFGESVDTGIDAFQHVKYERNTTKKIYIEIM
jgi:hypothetical protein